MQHIIDFILDIDRLKGVERKTKPLKLARYENSAEHSWQIAMLAMTMAPYAAPGVDIAHVVAMLLVHDIGEIETGDTMVYVETGWEQRKAEERAAIERIFAKLPSAERDRFSKLWDEFERDETPAAHFANALDRAMPALLNLANKGQSWRENGISHARVVNRLRDPISRGCPQLWTYLEAQLNEAQTLGYFGA